MQVADPAACVLLCGFGGRYFAMQLADPAGIKNLKIRVDSCLRPLDYPES